MDAKMKNEYISQLELLSIFHYVLGGIMMLFSTMPIMHVIMGAAIVSGDFFGKAKDTPPAFFGWMFIIMGSVFILFGWISSVCIIIAGRKLKRRKGRVFCMVVGGIECMFMPFGTVLGIFTLIILNKDSVKEIFDQSESLSA